ncbi:hypothetical protein PHYBLDRAFT_174552 [Phycomyces blakesleeanus NRRL 1555(-)]|uniref:Uncharacterized protein n=2 Tax=Phycomyces blakesleeanus TaxID=4837 RepID=A0A167K304_PHYB8|nr:hypothetical protein PHYBLDRAFT_174552 [Phycomyces blakesleeanus NRRL 1555(-)]OAD67168.1 hypothetical protein PHYBLDRAFT_174552 [Phycomyces blakesleeanus NRRL 1555(-)]|eukprot:XP_018285208.1 hypothetical protein PHYBLDRAFT_174552 [Phycomyces blakesleeanus NRRL 1555(-)]
MIDIRFCAEFERLDDSGKNKLWKSFHADFCNLPKVVAYAASPGGRIFSQNYKNIDYMGNKFEMLRREFGIILAEIRDSRLDEFQARRRFPHYDAMKEITSTNPSFWPDYVLESPSVCQNDKACPVLYTPRKYTDTYDVTYLQTPDFFKRIMRERDIFMSASPIPPPIPIPIPTQKRKRNATKATNSTIAARTARTAKPKTAKSK